MSLDITSVTNLVTSILGASVGTSYGTMSDTKRHSTGEILDAILDADVEVRYAILQSNSPLKASLYTNSSNLASGSQLPSSDGPYGAVLVDAVPARAVPAPEIARVVANVLAIPTGIVGKLFAILGNKIFHNGTTATIEIVTLARGTNTLGSPDSAAWAVVAGALAILFAKDGADTQTAVYFAREYDARLNLIRSGAGELSPVTPFQGGQS